MSLNEKRKYFMLLICSMNRSSWWIYLDRKGDNLIVYRLSELVALILIIVADFNELALHRKRAKPIPETLYYTDDNSRSI